MGRIIYIPYIFLEIKIMFETTNQLVMKVASKLHLFLFLRMFKAAA